MDWIDSHVHLEDEAFDADRVAVWERSRAAGVRLLVNAGSTASANLRALELCRSQSDIYLGMGLHPHEFPAGRQGDFQTLRQQLSLEKVVAVGETGLDFHLFPDFPAPDRPGQEAAFREQLELAKLFELPLIIHVRDAYPEALRLLREHAPFPAQGVLHCYAGGLDHLQEVLDLGFFIGVGATVTYPKAEGVRAAVRETPLERILVETDAPYLPPQGRRGQRNEPAWVIEAGRTVGQVKGLDLEQVADTTSANARRLFRLESGDPGTLVYDLKGHLYVNLTNRCSANCGFCPRRVSRMLQTYDLTLRREPLAAEVIAAIGSPDRYKEIVFCGFGEPTLRWPVLRQVAQAIKSRSRWVRVNTNGHGELIQGKDLLLEARGLVDEWSVSLNSANAEDYQRLVRPAAGRAAYPAVVSFIEHAAQAGFQVTVSAVEIPGADMAAVRETAERLSGRFRGRVFQRLGEPEDRD